MPPRPNRRRRSATAWIGAAAALLAAPLSAQTTVQASYMADDLERELFVHLDSITVAWNDPAVDVDDISDIVSREVVSVDDRRSLSDGVWIFAVTMSSFSRTSTATVVRAVADAPEVLWAGTAVRAHSDGPPAVVTDEFLVRFEPGVSDSDIDLLNDAHGVEIVRMPDWAEDHHILRVTDRSSNDVIGISHTYYGDPRTRYAEPNFLAWITSGGYTPTDPDFDEQWHLSNPLTSADIEAELAWDLTMGGPNTVIAVIEEDAFDLTHDEFENQAWDNPWEAGTDPGMEPVDTKPDDVIGWNFFGCTSGSADDCGTPDLEVGDEKWHGTHVAGMLAAVEGNGEGGSGVCPRCKVMFISLGGIDFGSTDRVTDAIDYAWKMGADVISASWHAPYNYFGDAVRMAMERAATMGRADGGTPLGTLMVMAVDNHPNTFDWEMCTGPYHELASTDWVMAVARTDSDDVRHIGPMGECLDIMAPGVDVFAPDEVGNGGSDLGDYAVVSGNSYAAPIVSGVAGLILTRNPTLTRDEVFDILINTAEKVPDPALYGGDGHSDLYGYGRVNALRALVATDPVTIDPVTGGYDEIDAPTLPVCDMGSSDPDVEIVCESVWEIGFRLGFTTIDNGTIENSSGVPGAGPQGAAVMYATYFPSSSWLFDLQAGIRRVQTSNTDSTNRSTGLLLGYRLPVGSWSVYFGPSLAVSDVSSGNLANAATTIEYGYGGAVGLRGVFGAAGAGRLDLTLRNWTGAAGFEVGLGAGIGLRLF